ncbi:MAG TPA: tRNA-intron lyase [Thermoplasmata archaeon]|nr:tRNA-intron lyase [Thermoplasmata archaeon]
MTGRLEADATVVVDDPIEASTVLARGFFGTLGGPGRLSLDRFESVYLSEMGRLGVVDARGRPVAWPDVYRRAARTGADFAVRYIVYRDLRQRGYVVRASPAPAAFAVLPRGGVLHKTPARYWVGVYSERVPFDLAALVDLVRRGQGAKKAVLLGVVDEESDLTYYRVRRPAPVGSLPPTRLTAPAPGWLAHDRVTIFDPAAVEALGRGLAYGSRIGDRLEVSLLEAGHLVATGQLALRDARSRRAIPAERLDRIARRLDRGYGERSIAYRALRSAGLVVKTGFKYGAHFRAYPRSPEHAHARYLVNAVPADHVGTWPTIAGNVRVAQGVRKEYLLAAVGPDARVDFLALERVRP